MSYGMTVTTTSGKSKVTFDAADMVQIRRTLEPNHKGVREEDLFGALIPGVFTDPRTDKPVEVILSKHHIIPENLIRDKLIELVAANKFVANKEDKLRKMFEEYYNHEDNIECQKTFLEYVPEKDRLTPSAVANNFRTIISWNPNNLRAGPPGNLRSDDPNKLVDYALIDAYEKNIVDGTGTASNNMNILDKLTALRSDLNPKWVYNRGAKCPGRNGICPWKVARQTENGKYKILRVPGVTVTKLIKRKLADGRTDDPSDTRRFNVETGRV